MDAFFQGLNQPSPQITDVSVDGTQNSPNQSVGSSNDPDYEVALDIQVAGASFLRRHRPARHHSRLLVAGHCVRSARRPPRTDATCAASPGAPTKPSGAPPRRNRWKTQPLRPPRPAWSCLRASGDNDSSDGGSTPANVDVPLLLPPRHRLRRHLQDLQRRNCVERQSRPDQRRRHRWRLLHHLSRSDLADRRTCSAHRNHRRNRHAWYPM